MILPQQTAVQASRREFITQALGASALGMAISNLQAAQPSSAGGRFRRYSLTDPAAVRDLDSYERAVERMLALPASDSRNWFRVAIVHLIDCPHGNWWFLPWHRGYLGYFEMICRELSQDSQFALPYWDWTADPQLPARFRNGMLNPANFEIGNVSEFRTKFEVAIQQFWDGMTPEQKLQVQARGLNSIDDLWKQIEGRFDPGDTAPLVPAREDVRKLNPPHTPQFDEVTRTAVSRSTILDALAPRVFIGTGSANEFIGFGSSKQDNHHGPFPPNRPVFGVLESQPHNLVHNEVGGYIDGTPSRQGYMSAFLSPSDPIFYMHHANIDRLWDVWTRKQMAHHSLQYPTLPPAADVAAWNAEPFLFFVGPDGQPSPKKQSGDFVDTANFNYDYQAGEGEIVVPSIALASGERAPQAFSSSVLEMSASSAVPGSILADLPTQAHSAQGVRLIAIITVKLPSETRDLRIHVFLNPPQGRRSFSLQDPGFVGTFEPFGDHSHRVPHSRGQELTFSLGLTDAALRLSKANRLAADKPFNVQIVADTPGINVTPIEIDVVSVVIQAF